MPSWWMVWDMRSDRRQGVTEAEFTGPATMPVLAVTLWALEGSSSSGSLLVFGHSNENNTDRDFKKKCFHRLCYSRVIVCICLLYFVFRTLSCLHVGIRKGTYLPLLRMNFITRE